MPLLLVRSSMRLCHAAVGAQAAHQALRQDAQQRVGKVERVEADLEQPRDALGRRVGVQRAQHQVAGERGLDRDARGFLVAHLADHDDVGVGAQEGAHGGGEGPADARVHLHLAQALLRDLDRVLGGPDLALVGVDVAHQRVQRGGLAAAGGAADQDQAVGLGHHARRSARLPGLRPMLSSGMGLEPASRRSTTSSSPRAVGTVTTRSSVLRAAEAREVDLAVLRLAVLGDVHARP
jgi:hypothetical protein